MANSYGIMARQIGDTVTYKTESGIERGEVIGLPADDETGLMVRVIDGLFPGLSVGCALSAIITTEHGEIILS